MFQTYFEPTFAPTVATQPRTFILDVRNYNDKFKLQLPHTDDGRLVFGCNTSERRTLVNVDLTYLDGRELGVSPLHALINLNYRPTITDLNSFKGTFLNGQRLLPYESRRLFNGDIIRLGHFKLYVTLDEAC